MDAIYNDDEFPLLAAIMHNHLNMVDILVANGADVNHKLTSVTTVALDRTVLHLACAV